jgi:hypothetical protein
MPLVDEFRLNDDYVKLVNDGPRWPSEWVVMTRMGGHLAITDRMSEKEAREYYEYWKCEIAANVIME